MTRSLSVGHIDLSSHDASAREVEAVLTRFGHAAERSTAPHVEVSTQVQASAASL
jgi:glycine betaine/proline transport system substrate-binding protein